MQAAIVLLGNVCFAMGCKRKSPGTGDARTKKQVVERLDSGFSTDKATVGLLGRVSNLFGIEDLKISRQWYSEVKQKQFEHVLTKLALPCHDSIDWEWDICELGALLNHFAHISAFYRDLLAIAIKKNR